MSTHFTKPGWAGAMLFGAALLFPPVLSAGPEAPEAARKVTRRVVPLYPAVAKRWHLEGTVKMTATVAPNGTVRAVKTLGGNAVLVLAAEEAVKQWKYEISTKETTEPVALIFKDTQ